MQNNSPTVPKSASSPEPSISPITGQVGKLTTKNRFIKVECSFGFTLKIKVMIELHLYVSILLF